MSARRVQEAETRVKVDEWDTDAWQTLAVEAGNAPLSSATEIYERLVERFPPCGRFWKLYAEHVGKEALGEPEKPRALYERGVNASPTSIELWRSYLAYASGRAASSPGSTLENEALALYERAIDTAGLDIGAHGLWQDYIDFLKKHVSLQDSQRRDALRKLYQRAVCCQLGMCSFDS